MPLKISTSADRVHCARIARHMTQRELAQAAGTSTATISAIERDGLGKRTGDVINALSRALTVSPTWLLRGDGEMSDMIGG